MYIINRKNTLENSLIFVASETKRDEKAKGFRIRGLHTSLILSTCSRDPPLPHHRVVTAARDGITESEEQLRVGRRLGSN
ncbi:hypothetical protein E2C01_034469 [Portunus trituberculatus]|uniref:Uncharacterized protein n=1 Tax=Portunus trituberculatus TaxID=210409 RepID=A0A5B7F5S2_PORTR|nr:hypothetical protein [Portunus trituberculatus]